MGEIGFAGPLMIGAGLLAVWFDYRLADRRPASATRRIAHTAAAYLVLQVTAFVFGEVAKTGAPATQRLVALFVLFLPALVYAFLSGLWLMRTLADVARVTR